MVGKNTCPYCHRSNIIKKGQRQNKGSKKQMYWCKDCKRRYTVDDGFWKMKNAPEIIAEAVSCYARGMSLQAVKDHLQDWRGVIVSRKTILMWVRKYSKILAKWEKKQRPKIRGPLHLDEVVLTTKGKKNWRWNGKDKKTRYTFSGPLTKKRTYKKGADEIFTDIYERAYDQFKERKKQGNPIEVVSDKLPHYRKGYNKYFRRVGKLIHGVPIALKKNTV